MHRGTEEPGMTITQDRGLWFNARISDIRRSYGARLNMADNMTTFLQGIANSAHAGGAKR